MAYLVDEAKKASEEGKEKVILVNFSGHGLLDLGSYEKYFAGELTNFALPEEEIEKSEQIYKNYPKPELVKSFNDSTV